MFRRLRAAVRNDPLWCDTPRSKWPSYTDAIALGCVAARRVIVHEWIVPLDQSLVRWNESAPPLKMTEAGLTTLKAHQLACTIRITANRRYVAPTEGRDYGDLLAAKLYQGTGFRTCPILAELLPTALTPALHDVFAKRLAVELFPADSVAAQVLGGSALGLAGIHMELMVCGLVAEIFGDERTSNEIAERQERFLKDVANDIGRT